MHPSCAHCRFWAAFDGRQGECRRQPPTLAPHIKAGRHAREGTWPVTFAHDFCGEFQPAVAVQTKECPHGR